MKSKPIWLILLDLLIKACSLIITIPVSWILAGQSYADINFVPIQIIVQTAAVLLVDIILLVHWTLLDYKQDDPLEQRIRYAAFAWVLYIGLFTLAIIHGEGFAGIVFRSAMGMALLSSTVNSFAVHWRNLVDRANQGVRRDWRVQRHHRKLSRQEEKFSRELEHKRFELEQNEALDIYTKRLLAERTIFDRQLALDTQNRLDSMDVIDGKAVPISDVQHMLDSGVQDAVQTVQNNVYSLVEQLVQDKLDSVQQSLDSVNKVSTIQSANGHKLAKKKTIDIRTQADKLEQLRKLMRESPDLSKTAIAEQLDMSRATLYKLLEQLNKESF